MIKKLAPFVTVGIFLIGLALVWNALEARALPSPDAGAVQPANTPAAPEESVQSPLNQLPSSLAVAGAPERARAGAPTAEQQVQDEVYVQRALQHAEALRQAGVRFQVPSPGARGTESISPQSPSETCMDMLSNPQMDVVEFGDGTGTVEYWTILYQKIYFSTQDYNSPSYSLVMVDETDGSDTDTLEGLTEDYDEFGQWFQAPDDLTYMKISYSRLYTNANSTDYALSNLWTLDSEGYLDELVVYASIGESPEGWSNRFWELTLPGDSALLDTLSGKPLALTFDMLSDRTAPGEVIWLDDAQVTLCYGPQGAPPYDKYIYLPAILRDFANQPPLPTCNPYEPDAVGKRGSTTVGATCSGSFSQLDTRDYYSLNLNGAANVRLRLYDLPSGTNWDALIYKDTGASPYPLACQIGTLGDDDKYANCTLNPSESYFVLVNAGTAPGGGTNTYKMSVEQR